MRIGSPKITGLTEPSSVSGTQFSGGQVIGEEYRTKLLDPRSALDEFDKMRKVDPMVHALLVAVTAPLLAADAFVAPSSKEPGETEKEWADALNDNLKNELCCTWDGFLSHAMLMYPMGFSLAEKVVKEDPRGWLLDDLAPIMPRSVHRWLPAKGGLRGIVQRAWDPGIELVSNPDPQGQLEGEEPEIERTGHAGIRDFTIPGYKLARFTYQQEGANYAGRSLLQPAFRPYFLKSRAERFFMIAIERQSVSVPIGKYPKNPGANDKAVLEKFLRNLRAHEKAYATIRHDFGIEMLNMAADSVISPMDFIQYCDQAIARTALGMFLLTGATQVGSRALMDPQIDVFMMSVLAGASHIAARMQLDVFEILTRLTHGDDLPVPRLVIEPKRMVKLEAVVDMLHKLSTTDIGHVKPFPELTEHILQMFDLPVPVDPLLPEPPTEEPVESPDEEGGGGGGVTPEVGTGAVGDVGEEPGTEEAVQPGPTLVDANAVQPVRLDDEGFRPATPVHGLERFVAFAEVRRETDQFEERLTEVVSDWMKGAGRALAEQLAADPDANLTAAAVPGQEKLQEAIQEVLLETFAYGRRTVGEERVRQNRAGEQDRAAQAARLREAQANRRDHGARMRQELGGHLLQDALAPAFLDNPAATSKMLKGMARALRVWSASRVTEASLQATVEAISAESVGQARDLVVQSVVAAVNGLSARLTRDKVREFVRPAFAKGRAYEAQQLRDQIAGVAFYTTKFDDDVCQNCNTTELVFGTRTGGVKLGSREYYSALPPNRSCKGRRKCRCGMVYG